MLLYLLDNDSIDNTSDRKLQNMVKLIKKLQNTDN